MTDLNAAAAVDDSTPKSARRRRGQTAGHSLKLDAPARPGYVRRWVNGDPSRIAQMKDLNYQFVQDKAASGRNRTSGQGSRISRHAGKTENGEPLQTYLMETPEEDYAIGAADREERLKPFEDAIRAGRDTTAGVEDAYQPNARSTINHTG